MGHPFNAYELLNLDNPAKSGLTCVGFAPSQGRRCWCTIAQHNIDNARMRLRNIPNIVNDRQRLVQELTVIASLTLCRRWHQDQANEVAAQWYRTVRLHVRQLSESSQANTSNTSRSVSTNSGNTNTLYFSTDSSDAVRNRTPASSTRSSHSSHRPEPLAAEMADLRIQLDRLRQSIGEPQRNHSQPQPVNVNVQVNVGRNRTANSTAPRARARAGVPEPPVSPSGSSSGSSTTSHDSSSSPPDTPPGSPVVRRSPRSRPSGESSNNNNQRDRRHASEDTASIASPAVETSPSREPASDASTVTLDNGISDHSLQNVERDDWTDVGSAISVDESEHESEIERPLTPPSPAESVDLEREQEQAEAQLQAEASQQENSPPPSPQPLPGWHASWQDYESKWRDLSLSQGSSEQDRVPWPVRTGKLEDVNLQAVQDFFSQGPSDNLVENDDAFCRLLRRHALRWRRERIAQRFTAGSLQLGLRVMDAVDVVVRAIRDLVALP